MWAPPLGLLTEYSVGAERASSPTLVAIEPNVGTGHLSARWAGASPATFHVRWLGYLTVLRGGEYVFALTSDDAGYLEVDGIPVIDDRGRHPPHTQTGLVTLEPGPHVVLIEMVQDGGTFTIDWRWTRNRGTLTPIPDWLLTPAKTSRALVIGARIANLGTALLLILATALALRHVPRAAWSPRRHPRAAAFALFVVLAVAHTWPLATDPAHLTRHDNRDTMLNEWILAWVAHQAVTRPLDLFDANIFYPERHTLAFSEAMIVQSAMGAPLLWAGASPVLTYNLLLIAGFVMSGWAMCLVVQRWTDDWTAGLVSGLVFGFCAHTLTRLPHLQTQHVQFLPLALFALDALLRQPTTSGAVRLALWSVLQSLTSIYLLVFTMIALAVGVVVRPADWRGARFFPVSKALGITMAIAALGLLPFVWPYYRASEEQGVTRSLADAALYSASWRDYLTTPARVHASWSQQFAGGTGLFPGALGLLLAGVALVRGTAFKDRRARMAMAIGIGGVCLSFGPAMPGYTLLYTVFPLLQAIRATARFGYLGTLAVAILAGYGVVALRQIVPGRLWSAAALILVAIAGVEQMAAPLGLSRFDAIAPVYSRLSNDPDAVVVEVPFHGPRSAQFHAHYMLNSTAHWRPLVNGYSGFQPASFYRHAEGLQSFPADEAMVMLREIGVTHVFVHRSMMGSEQLRALDARPDLERIDSFGETELYVVKRLGT